MASSPVKKRLHILLAEDNDVNQEVARHLLERRGHQVTVVENGARAVEAARSGGDYDVVLMDLYMPEMDGIPATTAIRALPAWDQIPIVAVTADPGPEERARCLAAGMNGFLAKPFRPEELFAAVEGWVEASLRDPPRKVAEDSDPVDIAAFRVELEGAGVASAVDGLLAVFKGDAPGRMVALESALGSGDLVAIRLAAHAYKSAAGAVRATRLAALLGRIERAALEGSVADATNLGAACREAHGEVLSFLGD